MERRIAFYSKLFDHAVNQCEEGSVALYSLGNSQILREATAEVVSLFDVWALLKQDKIVLQIGCGTGRFERELACRVKEGYGVDVSPNMIKVAERRCRAFDNIHFAISTGQDLAMFSSGKFDLVYAVDSFPYIYEIGIPLVAKHFAEVSRVIKNRGNFVILNFSYRNNLEADRADICKLAGNYGFEVLVNGERLFELWDGVTWRLRRCFP